MSDKKTRNSKQKIVARRQILLRIRDKVKQQKKRFLCFATVLGAEHEAEEKWMAQQCKPAWDFSLFAWKLSYFSFCAAFCSCTREKVPKIKLSKNTSSSDCTFSNRNVFNLFCLFPFRSLQCAIYIVTACFPYFLEEIRNISSPLYRAHWSHRVEKMFALREGRIAFLRWCLSFAAHKSRPISGKL